jgi:tetratricopeptide (TPR) repeat protein
MGENQVSCPLLNAAGQVIGMMQQPAVLGDSLSYAVSASFADSLKLTGITFHNETMNLTQVKKLLPTDIKEAALVLYFSGSQVDSAEYVSLIHDFIQQFPSAPDGYTYRAQQEMAAGNFAAAERDMEQALKFSEAKDDTHYIYARMIYNKEVYQSAQPYTGWSLDKALQHIQAANSINPQPTYRQLEGDIRFAQQHYDEAYEIYNSLLSTNLRSPEIFFAAARCKEMQKDTTAMLALMDSTINMYSKPYLKEVAPYIWARAEARRNAGRYREAISDMNEYESLMTATVNDNFYYIRHQVEIQGHLYQQALNDINRAIQMNSNEILYYAEKASLEIRVGLYDQAIATAKECISLDPKNSDGYLFLGLAQCLKGQKPEGIRNLQKAKELGDTQADALIEKYNK